MGTYTAKTRTVGRRPRSKRLRELGGTVTISNGGQPDLSPYELLSNKVTEVDQNSTDEQYPTAKLLYDLYAALGALIDALDEGKQDAIADLAAIRSGAALGATALQAITAAAGSDIGTVGTPSVTVSTQGSSTTLTFHQLKGEKGDPGNNGTNGTNGTNGATWYSGTAVTGTNTSGISASVSGSKAGDFYLNTSTWDVYKATAANTWGYVGNIKGATGPAGSGGATTELPIKGFGTSSLTFYQESTAFAGYTGGWASYIIANHGNGSSYYNYIIGLPFWSTPIYSRMNGGSQSAWHNFLTDENYSSYALPLSGGTISDQAITANKSVVAIAAKCTAPTANIAVYGVKAELDCSGTPPTNTNSAAIYGYAKFGYAGYFNGGVRVTATLTANSVSATTLYQTSDDRLKDYLGDFHFNLADIDRIPLRFFAFKADKERRVLLGTSAQAVQKVLPEIVGSSPADDGEEYLSVDYSKLALVALDCVRQLRDEVATMKAEMAAMRAEIKELKSGR